MEAFVKGGVGMACMQYTIRGVPLAFDLSLRQRAKAESKSLNQFLLETLEAGLGFFQKKPKNEALRSLAHTWVEDPDADKAFSEMRMIDEGLWS